MDGKIIGDIPRKLSQEEETWVCKLLSVDFLGKDALVEQLKHVQVIGHCNCGKCKSIILKCNHDLTRFPSEQRVPVEMTLYDHDGVPILFLLHVIDGYVSELEVLLADSEPITHVPECHTAVVTINEDWSNMGARTE